MAGAVLAAMLLTLLLPSDLRLGPRWLLPILEGALLVALIVGDPGRISKRSSMLRGFSIALVTVLIARSLWSTARLIDELIVGGAHTNKLGPLLAAAAVVWVAGAVGQDGDGRAGRDLVGGPWSGGRAGRQRADVILSKGPN